MWTTVDALIQRADREAGNNAWLKDSFKSIKRYARDEERMSKEAHYSSRKMMNRMAELNESLSEYSPLQESRKAKHLQRKQEQGKRMDRPE